MAQPHTVLKRGAPEGASRLPPGQYVTTGFPVLSAGPTPHTPRTSWNFSVQGAVRAAQSWAWDEFRALPREAITADIHCVTTWSKFDTVWSGVSLDTVLDAVGPTGRFALAFCDGGYTTNIPLDDLRGGRAWVVDEYAGEPLQPEHGGPARLLVPHLYFWKSAKWIRGIDVRTHDEPGFWETYGYHDYGDPWREQRYQGD